MQTLRNGAEWFGFARVLVLSFLKEVSRVDPFRWGCILAIVKHNGQVEGEQWEGRELQGCRRWQPRESNISWEENRDVLVFVVKFKQGAGQSGDWKPLQTIAKRHVISHRKTSTLHRSSNAAKSKLCWQTPNQRDQTEIEELPISQLNVKSFWGPSSQNFVSILMEGSLGFCENNFAFRISVHLWSCNCGWVCLGVTFWCPLSKEHKVFMSP